MHRLTRGSERRLRASHVPQFLGLVVDRAAWSACTTHHFSVAVPQFATSLQSDDGSWIFMKLRMPSLQTPFLGRLSAEWTPSTTPSWPDAATVRSDLSIPYSYNSLASPTEASDSDPDAAVFFNQRHQRHSIHHQSRGIQERWSYLLACYTANP